MFLFDQETGQDFPEVDTWISQLDNMAKLFKTARTSAMVKIPDMVQKVTPVYSSILEGIMTFERSRPQPVIYLSPKSYNVYARWQKLAQALGILKRTKDYNDAAFRILLEQIDTIATNYKKSTSVQIIREYLANDSFDNTLVDASVLLQYATTPKIGFDDIIGMTAIKNRIKFLLVKIKKKWTTRVYNRLILYGPPGTGKTMFVAAIAKELNYLFIKLGVNELSDRYVGEAEKRLASIIRAASEDTQYPGVLILFDEIDSFTGRGDDVSVAQKNITTTMLQEIDGNLSDHLFICATTNFPNRMDEALKRRLLPGIAITLPDGDSIKQFFQKKSIFSALLLQTLNQNDIRDMVDSRYSQDNITQLINLTLDNVAEFSFQEDKLFSPSQGYSFNSLYADNQYLETIYYRNDKTGAPLPTGGTIGLPAVFENVISAEIKKILINASGFIITTSQEGLRSSMAL